MRFIRNRRGPAAETLHEDDPLAGIANLFDLSLVFIVAMLMALFSMVPVQALFKTDAEWTLTRKTAAGELEIVTRKNQEIKVQRVTSRKLSGNGTRLGVAYKLADGRVVYVSEKDSTRSKK